MRFEQAGLLVLLPLLAGMAVASPRESFNATSVESRARQGEMTNVMLSATFTGSYSVGRLAVQGQVRPLAPGSFASEAQLRVTAPSGHSYILQSRAVATFAAPLQLSPSFSVSLPQQEPAAGTWTIEFFESFDDQTGADSIWDNFTLTLDDDAPPPPPPGPASAEDLGSIAAGTSRTASVDGFVGSPPVKWYKFSVPFPANSTTGIYLDADTNDTYYVLGDDRVTDTVVALYDAWGNLIAADDDDGAGLASMVSFGAVSARNGAMSQDGPLQVGQYYLAVAPSGTAFGAAFLTESPVVSTPAYVRVKLASGFATTPSQPTAIDLGTLTSPGITSPATAINAGQVLWFRFTATTPASSPTNYLDIDTEGSSLPLTLGGSGTTDDTSIGLFDSQGRLIATDDDDASGYLSAMSFGSGSGTPGLGDGLLADGRDGTLLDGTYFLAVGGRGTVFGPTGWAAHSEAAESGTVRVNILTNTGQQPCPADFNGDGFADGFDYDDFVACFEGEACPPGKTADFNNDGFPDGFDYDDYVEAFETGCL